MDDLPEEEKPGIPGWVVTFADLMSLLMCFFVLLLSFSEIDAQKFKQIAGELSKAFGVQREVPALEIPQGTSPIFDKFSPAPPEPTLLEQVKQTTTTEDPEIETLKNPEETEVAEAVQEQMDQRVEIILDLADDVQEEVVRLRELMDSRSSGGRQPTVIPTIEPGPAGNTLSW
jgi:chemotaxis protein MotB